MNIDECTEIVKDITCEMLGLNDAGFLSTATFNEIGADSIDEIEMLVAIEEELGLMIPDDDAELLTTPKRAIDYIMSIVD